MKSIRMSAAAFAFVTATAMIGIAAAQGQSPAIWKTITLGTYRNANVLREALDSEHCNIEKGSGEVAGLALPTIPINNDGPKAPFCHLEELANEIIGRPAFGLSPTKTELDLVVLSVSELGFGERNVSISNINARAESLGFALCPPEAGPQLRLQYLDQPLGEVLHIAMQPIARYNGDLVYLDVENGLWGLVLFGSKVTPLTGMDSSALFVFVKPRYGDNWN